MKLLKAAGAYYGEFVTQRFDTGAATDADSLPVATATKNGTDDGAFTLTVTKIDTGRYKITGTIPAYSAGDQVQISVAATVNSVAGKGVVDDFVVVSGRPGIDDIPIEDAVLAASQPSYAPAKAGDSMVVSDKTGFSLTVTPPTKEEISTKVWSETIRSLTDKAGFALATSPPTAAQIDTQLSGTHGAGAWGASSVGSSTYTDTILDPDGDPIESVSVECYSDSDRTTLVQVQTTDANGAFTFYLNPATYYFRAIKTGYTFTNWSEVVS